MQRPGLRHRCVPAAIDDPPLQQRLPAGIGVKRPAVGVPAGYLVTLRPGLQTAQQGLSGLGLEAQREAVERHVRSVGGTVLAEYLEVEGGKRSDRPKVAGAIAACQTRHAILVIAKLDWTACPALRRPTRPAPGH